MTQDCGTITRPSTAVLRKCSTSGAKEWTTQQQKIKAAKQSKASRGSPTSKNAPQHVADADMPLDPLRGRQAPQDGGSQLGELQEGIALLHELLLVLFAEDDCRAR